MDAGLLVTFVCYFFVMCNGIRGSVDLSEEEDLELEKQLRILNKPAVKSIKTDYGYIYDCVDFYEQPAFDHPLLKNHSYNFQMKPRFAEEKVNGISPETSEIFPIGLKDGGCPVGTVPIKRTTKEDLIRNKLFPIKVDTSGTLVSVARTKNREQFTGALAFISLYNPVTTGQQYSAARMKLQNADDFIQFGWRVDPTLYGDNYTHIFIQTYTDTARCYDVKCGFVVTNTSLSPGLAFPPQSISVKGKDIFETKLKVQRDKDGKWWLLTGKDNVPAGFWPKELFNGLSEYAIYADWGGEVSSPHGVPGPEMGSGQRPIEYDSQNYAYMRYIAGVDISGNDVNPETDYYDSIPFGFYYDAIEELSKDPVWGHTVYFGGVGTKY